MVSTRRALMLTAVLGLAVLAPGAGSVAQDPVPSYESQQEADAKNPGCLSCHTATDSRSMHATADVLLSCVDCHGGERHGAGQAGGPRAAGRLRASGGRRPTPSAATPRCSTRTSPLSAS